MSVCGTGTTSYTQGFSRLHPNILPYFNFGPLRPGLPIPGICPSRVSPCLNLWWLRNFNRMCIDYAFRPRLSSRLTRSGRTFLLKPEAFGHYDSHIILATHSSILTSIKSTRAYAHASPRMERSPTIHSSYFYPQSHEDKSNCCVSQASVYSLAPLNFRRRVTRPVSYYALF